MPTNYYDRNEYPRTLEGRFPTSLERKARQKQQKLRRWIVGGVVGAIAAGVVGLGLWASDGGETIGRTEEMEFAEDAVNGAAFKAYPHIVVINADPETLKEPVRVRSTPKTDDTIEFSSSKNNRTGRLLTSVSIENPMLVHGHWPLKNQLLPEEVTPESIQAYLDWINDDILGQTREDGSPYAVRLCKSGVDPWRPITARLNQEHGYFETTSGDSISTITPGTFTDLVEQAQNNGYSQEAC